MTAVDRENERRALLQARTYEADQLTPEFVEDRDLGQDRCVSPREGRRGAEGVLADRQKATTRSR